MDWIKDAQNNTTSFTYDGRGNRLSSTDPLLNVTNYTYDSMNRLTDITPITSPATPSTHFGYDYRGRRTSVTDANGMTTAYQYDDADRLVAVTDAASNLTVYGYDTENNLVDITDAAGHQTSFAYDAYGRVTQVTFPSTLSESYAYDAMNNLLSKSDRNGHTINYGYDALYRMTSKSYTNYSAGYSYDPVSRLTQVTDSTGTYSFTYDNLGRLVGTGTQYSFLSGTLSNSYGYDAASNRTSLTDAAGGVSTYSYDTLNRLTGLLNSVTGNFGFGYDVLGRRTSLTRPNGINTAYGYDTLSNLLSVLHNGGSLPGSTSYSYDAAGNRTSKTAVQQGDPNPVSVTSNFSYDNIYELTQAVVNGSVAEGYSYDAVGNRLSSAGPTSYNYNASNELTSTSSATYTYDNNGNTLSKTETGGTTYYTWDFENRLASVTLSGTGGSVYFKYDPFGRRVEKVAPSTGTTIYAYDGANVTEEFGAAGNLFAQFTQGAGTDEPLAIAESGGTYYYHADGLGSITSLTNGSGQLAASYVYDSFGNLTASTGTITNPFQYTAREFDSETGLYYYRARYYDPPAGRFMSGDPLAFNVGPNFYEYVTNSPVSLSDPNGLYGASDVLPAWNHYCGGSGTPWTTPFSSINWGDTQNNINTKIKGMVGSSCTERTIPVNFSMNAQTAGADAYIIGRHIIKAQGTIQVHCDCTWSFNGSFSSKLGYDPYDFDSSNRGPVGETLTWIGAHRCPSKGKPFNIYLPGSIGLSFGGKVDGKPTCDKCKTQ